MMRAWPHLCEWFGDVCVRRSADGRATGLARGPLLVNPAMALLSCDACGKGGCKLLRCGRCRGVWFCNRECQVAAARQGHSGANCRPANGAQRPPSLANARSPIAAPSRTSKATDVASL